MITSKYLNILVLILMSLAVLAAGFLTLYPHHPDTAAPAEPEYASKLFNKEQIMEINIEMEPKDFDWIIDNATREEYRQADVTINGNTYHNVGIRPKGNSSLRMVAQDKNSDRFSFKVKFEALEIMREAEGGQLSAAQIARLQELGLDDSMIDRMKNMPTDM
ncbi:MAG: hypothetical protein PHG94_09565, partial [Syntrophomonas sp.]|nr:hypothetical protein [Syntrophomonas sp.]